MSKKTYFFILTIIGGIFFTSLFDHTEALMENQNSDNIKKLCESKYDSYKKLGKENFAKTYSHLTYIQDCFGLFSNPSWTFNGKEKIDWQYEKYYQITSQVNPQITNFENQNLEIHQNSINRIGYQNYVLKIRICAENKDISEPKFFVITDKEYFLAKSSRDLKEDSCNFIMVYTTSVNPEKINFIPFDGNYMPSKYMKIKSVF